MQNSYTPTINEKQCPLLEQTPYKKSCGIQDFFL